MSSPYFGGQQDPSGDPQAQGYGQSTAPNMGRVTDLTQPPGDTTKDAYIQKLLTMLQLQSLALQKIQAHFQQQAQQPQPQDPNQPPQGPGAQMQDPNAPQGPPQAQYGN